MKNRKTLIMLNAILPIRRIFHSSQFALSAFAMLLALVFWTGCHSTNTTEDPISEDEVKSKKVHVAFAGGGWRAHTGHSAWTLSLLGNSGNRELSDAFANVSTIASNSGGSWFSTMLMYSGKFVSDIESPNAINTWATTSGWLGKQKMHFNSVTDCGEIPYIECVFDTYTKKDIKGGLFWHLVVEDLIFKDYPLGNMTLNGTHQPWAVDKSLLLASTMLNNEVVLNENDWGDIRYYQACLSPSKPISKKKDTVGLRCDYRLLKDVTPVTFSSIQKNSKLNPPPFLPELGIHGKFNMEYAQDNSFTTTQPIFNTVQLPLHNDGVPVMVAAAASSAAVGFGASKNITGSFDDSYELEDDALTFQLTNSTAKFVDISNAENMSLETLANNKVVRLADGGPADNSGVAQLVTFLQLNKQADGFNIVAFDNVQSSYKPDNGAANVGVDIASLFGQKEKFCINTSFGDYCVTTPKVQIFDKKALMTTPTTWSTNEGNQQLIYTKYSVTTVDNSVFGISAGTKGTLHSFTCVSPNASTEPLKPTDFNIYTQMLQFINKGLNQNNGEGLKHLEAAFGLH